MKLQQLRYFVAVYEEGSITAGAERAHATQSGLSMQIKDLEERYDAVLFERAASGVHPTEMGRRFYEYATRILKEVADAEQAMKEMRGIVTGHIRVGLMPTFTRSILPPAVQTFSDEYPLVDISVVEAYSAQLTKDVLQGNLDFAIVSVPPGGLEAGLLSHSIGKDRVFLVSRNESDSRHLEAADASSLKEVKLILAGSKNMPRSMVDDYFGRHGVEMSAVIEMDTMMGTLELVAQSDWKTIVAGTLCLPDIDGDRYCLNPMMDAPELEYVTIELKSGRLSAAAQLFADAIKKEFENQSRWSELLP